MDVCMYWEFALSSRRHIFLLLSGGEIGGNERFACRRSPISYLCAKEREREREREKAARISMQMQGTTTTPSAQKII